MKTVLEPGMIVPRKWLHSLGLDSHSIEDLAGRGFLEVITKGVYTKWPKKCEPEDVFYSLQEFFSFDMVPGGLTALWMHSCNGSLNNETSCPHGWHLFGMHYIPLWVKTTLGPASHHNRSKLMGKEKAGGDIPAADYEPVLVWRGRPVRVSSREKAILEVLADVPEAIPVSVALEEFARLQDPDTKKLQQLLEACDNFKVRRLFLWMAENCAADWVKDIDPGRFDIGKGNRTITKGGKFYSKYKIVV